MKIYFRHALLTILMFMAGVLEIIAQNAPLTFCDSVSVSTPGTVDVPVNVESFNDIGAISLTIDYDFAVIQFIEGIPHASFSSFSFGDLDLGNGFHRISMGWFGSGSNLPDGSTLLTLRFNYTAGNSELAWYDNGASCEYADGSYNVLNDLPTEDYYYNGYVCASVLAPIEIFGADSVCQGWSGESYSIDELPDATGYFWTVPAGVTISSGQNTNAITVDFGETAMSGLVEVFGYNQCGDGPSSQLAVTISELPVADAGDDFTINYGTSTILYAAPGGPGNYSYHWFPEELLVDPFVQNPQTVILTTTTLFTLLVTNLETGCEDTDEVTVTITGGPLNVNPICIPNTMCLGENAQLFANAGGGSGNYTYQWSSIPAGNPPWSSTLANPVVSPDSSRQYILSVDDGFTIVNGSTNLAVHPLPTASISGGDTLCGNGNTTTLTVELTGTPPWNFTYTYGSTSVTVSNVTVSPFTFLTGGAGTYTVSFVEDAHCTGTSTGSATVLVFPVPATPEISVNGTALTSSNCCGNQWYLNEEAIPGATEQTYVAQVSGEYFVIVTLNGCSSDTSEIVDVTVGIKDNSRERFLIYPVPAHDRIVLQALDEQARDLQVRILGLDGRVLEHRTFSGPAHRVEIWLSDLSPGIYLLQIETDKQLTYRKLIVN